MIVNDVININICMFIKNSSHQSAKYHTFPNQYYLFRVLMINLYQHQWWVCYTTGVELLGSNYSRYQMLDIWIHGWIVGELVVTNTHFYKQFNTFTEVPIHCDFLKLDVHLHILLFLINFQFFSYEFLIKNLIFHCVIDH